MGLRTTLVGLLSRGEAPELDPEELVEVATVPVAQGPIMVDALRHAGLDVVALDTFNAATALHGVQARVPRRQLAEATEVLDALR